MKKTLSILLIFALLTGCAAAVAEAAEKTYLATVNMGDAFELKCAIPEGYAIRELEASDSIYIALITADASRPTMYLSIAYNELYSDVERLNNLDAEALALIEGTFDLEEEVEITYTETSHGTKLMMVKEVEDTVDFVDFYSIYLGYEIEIILIAQDENGLTDEQIQMAVDFLSELDFVASEYDAVPQPEAAKAFDGVWQCGRATIAMYWEEEGFKVLITWGSSAWEQTEWEYSCFYHDEDNTVVSMPFGTRTEIVYNDEGEIASANEVYSDGDAVFSLDEEGCLIWQDEKENAGEGMRFEKIPEEPNAV